MAEHIGCNAAPKKLQYGATPVRCIDAGAPEFEHAPGKLLHGADVVLIGRIEAPRLSRAFALEQPIRADDAFRPWPDRVVDDDKMIGDPVEGVAVPPRSSRARVGRGAHFLVEHAEAQRLDSVDLAGCRRDPDTEIAGPEFTKPRTVPRHGAGGFFSRHRGALPCCGADSAGSRERDEAGRWPGTSETVSALSRCVSRRRPNNSNLNETRSKPSRAAIACITCSCSASSNSITLPVSMSIR